MRKIIIIIVFAITLSSCKQSYIEYTDIDMYKDREYTNEEKYGDTYLYDAGKIADKFFVPYDEIDFEYKVIKFYAFDGTNSLLKPGVSLTVDFYFGDNYSQVKEQFMEKFEFYQKPFYKLNTDNFECLMVKDPEITRYVDYFGLICFNEEDGIIRQFFYYDENFPFEDKSLEEYFEENIEDCSNCPW